MTTPTTLTTRKASFAASSVDLERRTAELIFSVGAKVLRSTWADGTFYEELSLDPKHVRMERLSSGRAPFLKNHDSGDVAAVVGVVESARIEGGKGVARVRFASDAESDVVFQKIAEGVLVNVSVGYRIWKTEKLESVDATTPTIRVVDWEPYEISAVPIGADAGAFIRQFNPNGDNNVKNRKKLQQQDDGNGGGGGINAEEIARLERERVSGIRAAVRSAQLGDDLAARLIAGGATLDASRKVVLDVLAARDATMPPNANGSHITGGEDESEKWQRGATAALLERAVPGLIATASAAKVAGFNPKDLEGNHFRGMTLGDLAREALERRGMKTRGMGRQALAGAAFTMRGGPYAGTGDFPILLENVMNKTLLGSYAVTPDTWSQFSKIELVPDFRPSSRYRAGSFGALDTVAENGEFKNKAIPDGSKSEISIGTKGNLIAISRQLIVNDDLGALTDLLQKLGRAAKLSIETDVYALLAANAGLGPTQTDGQPFFHANRANVNATGSALTVAGLDADRVVLGSQKDAQNNEFLDLRPAVLLVPLSLGSTARVLNSSAINPDANGKIQQPNPIQGIVRSVVDTARLTGTRRYIFADPSVAPAVVVAFLEEQGQNPVLESQDGWRIDGTEMKVRFDYGASMVDPKGAVTNAGQ